MQAQEIWIDDIRYFLLNDGSIVPEDWQGEIGYAALVNGVVWRYSQPIARISDVRFGNMVEIEATPEILTKMLFTIFGVEDDTD